MNRWFKRLGYAILIVFWLFIMAFPTFAFFLATRGELQFRDDPRSHMRFFMVQEEASSGIGIEWVRDARGAENCSQTSIRYFLWEGDGRNQNTNFCQCYDPISDAPLPIEESRCTP
ncbi:hypothetical protein [Candidatus Leptofilum sp.]|uniref:hypothetical protein n=1 Tax=Candidatus Leptofilum sp. TaxID=3241576 RepID=UPI003B59C198